MRTKNVILQERAGVVKQAYQLWHRHDGTANTHSAEELAEFDRLQARADALQVEADNAGRREAIDSVYGSLDQTEGRQTSHQMPHTDDRNTRNGRHGYSVLKFLRQQDPSNKDERLDGIEREASDEIAKRCGKSGDGFYMPYDLHIDSRHAAGGRSTLARLGVLSREQRATLDTTAGAGTVPTIVDGSVIEILRNRVLLAQLGATLLTGLVGNLSLPKQTAAGTSAWLAEGVDNTSASSQTIGQIGLTPRRISSFTEYSKLLLKQTSIDIEMWARSDLARVLAIALDLAGFTGSGTSNQPLGIINNPNVNVVALGTNGLAPTWAPILKMESVMDDSNALDGSINFVTTPKGRGTLKGITKLSGSTFSDFIWDSEGRVNTYPAWSTKNVPSNLTKGSGTGLSAAILGDFSCLLMGLWGDGVDTVVNPYSKDTAGLVRITMEQYADVNLRYPEAFSVIKDMITV